MIYLDSAATSLQKPPEVARAMAKAVTSLASPGRGGHRPATLAGDIAFRCRSMAADLFRVPDPEQVIFTANATHALNIAIRSLVRAGDKVVISGWEHNAVTRTLADIPDVKTVVASAQLFDQKANYEAFLSAITSDVKVVIFTHISNVFGFILPVKELSALCRARQIPFIVDASQSAGCAPIDFAGWGADFVAMPGHKGLLGPQGTGLLLCKSAPSPVLTGGTGSESLSQAMPSFLPDRLEAGTHNMPGIAGLLEGMSYVQSRGIGRISAHEGALLRRLGRGLGEIEGVTAYLSQNPAVQSGVLSICVDGWDCENLGEALGERGICVRAGLHCAPLAHRSGGTLEGGTLRIGLSPFNTPQEIDKFLQILAETIQYST